MTNKRKVIIHIITLDYSRKQNFIVDLETMNTFSSENSVYNFYFYKDDKEPPILLNNYYAEVHNYIDEDKLEEKLILLSQREDIIYISTPFATNVPLVNRLKKAI
jgi:thiamine kinase-like enzyme